LIGIEPEVIERAVANGVGVLILRQRFRAPRNRASVLSNSPRSAAVTLVVKRAIICPARMLNRRMKPDVRDVDSWPHRHAERLDRAIEVLVVQSVFIMPDARRRICYFITHEPDTIISRVRLLPAYSRARPGHDRWLFPHSGAHGAKAERCRSATHVIPLVRSIVVHVALAGVTLTPGVFVRNDVFCFGEIQRAYVLGRDQVIRVHQNSVRRCIMAVTAMIVGC